MQTDICLTFRAQCGINTYSNNVRYNKPLVVPFGSNRQIIVLWRAQLASMSAVSCDGIPAPDGSNSVSAVHSSLGVRHSVQRLPVSAGCGHSIAGAACIATC